MATTKKASTGTKAGAGARKVEKKANGVAKETKSKPAAKAPAPATAPKKAATIKLNDRQREFLKKIKDAGEAGFSTTKNVEQRTIDALAERKLVKKGPKDKGTGKQPFLLTKAGEKHLTSTEPVAVAAPSTTS